MDGGVLELILTSSLMDAIINSSGDKLLENMKIWFPKAVNDICDSRLSSLIDIIVPIAVGIMTIYFLVDLISKSTTANFSMEIFVRSFIKYVIGFALISNCDALAGGIIKFGDALVAEMSTAGDFQYSTKSVELLKYLQTHFMLAGGYRLAWRLIFKAILQVAMSSMVNLMVKFVVYNRAIKIFIYRVLLPISVADIFGRGLHQGALSPIKRLLGLAVQYPMVYIIGILTCVFINEVDVMHTNWISIMGQVGMIFIVVIGTVKKSADEAMQMFR